MSRGSTNWLGAHSSAYRVVRREHVLELVAPADLELREHVVQVPLDGARAEKEASADFGVREAVAGEVGDERTCSEGPTGYFGDSGGPTSCSMRWAPIGPDRR
jgi:hypothetical protein